MFSVVFAPKINPYLLIQTTFYAPRASCFLYRYSRRVKRVEVLERGYAELDWHLMPKIRAMRKSSFPLAIK